MELIYSEFKKIYTVLYYSDMYLKCFNSIVILYMK